MNYRKVLITGAGGDLGTELCRQFAQQGTAIVAVNRSRQPIETLSQSLPATAEFHPYFVDQSDCEATDALLPTILAEHSDIDLVLLNAGIDKPQKLTDFDWRLAKQHFDINVISNYVFLAHLVPYFLRRGQGHIAAVSSLAGYAGFPYEHVYNGSKAAVRMMVDGIRIELQGSGIAVTGIYPGFLEGRMAEGNAWQVDGYLSQTEAAATIIAGLQQGSAEIAFPAAQAEQVAQVLALPQEERDSLIAQMMAMD
ncbi:SDR family NAD(P)-dependent oxidoreductase [Aestuariicella hydrocarbonica]|uniref:SDR family NAD(P)-dependent oxidoreductase n=1 Tax=Pseudomaricurvus hydrocarbonicus TaxID=1470433 RepID=A0A9E5MNG0_9GAMM|nr:SDR family NAD(P)-dependent oxidoreductase [Aestuariicella hydrocarbonica]NHO67476.1 SDR family NAD(P)-dependent oxidoreductase [Aestuariicella hydrocarbonica]